MHFVESLNEPNPKLWFMHNFHNLFMLKLFIFGNIFDIKIVGWWSQFFTMSIYLYGFVPKLPIELDMQTSLFSNISL